MIKVVVAKSSVTRPTCKRINEQNKVRRVNLSYTIIDQGKFFDTSAGEFMLGTIVVKDEKIIAVDKLETSAKKFDETEVLERYKDVVTERDEVKVIDGTGLYITPGFIDTCSSIGLKETGVRWDGDDSYEPTFEKGYELDVVDGIYPFDASFQDARAAGVTASHIMSAAEQVVGAKTAVIHTAGITTDEMVLKRNVGNVFSMGEIPKNAFFDRTKMPLTRMGIAQKIRESLQALIDSGVDLGEHAIFIRCYRKDDIDTALRIGRAFNIDPILVHATDYDPAVHQETWKTSRIIAGPFFQAIEREELYDLNPDLLKKLLDAGLTFSLATDHPTSDVKHLRLESILALKSGVPEADILHSLTAGAAKLLGVHDLTGSIEKGLLADLVIWDEYPLDYPAKVKRTFIKGQEVFVDEGSKA